MRRKEPLNYGVKYFMYSPGVVGVRCVVQGTPTQRSVVIINYGNNLLV